MRTNQPYINPAHATIYLTFFLAHHMLGCIYLDYRTALETIRGLIIRKKKYHAYNKARSFNDYASNNKDVMYTQVKLTMVVPFLW